MLENLKSFLDSIQMGVTLVDAQQPDFPLVYLNPAFEKLTGYAAHEMMGQNCRFLQRYDVEQEALKTLDQALKAGRECRVMLRSYRKDGTLFWNDLQISPYYDEAGVLTHFVGIQTDATRYYRGDVEFNEGFYRLLVHNLPEMALLLFDHDLRFLIAEGSLLATAGYNKHAMEGKTIYEVVPPDRVAALEPIYKKALQGQKFAFDLESKERNTIYHINVVPVEDDQQQIVAGMLLIQDITESRQVETAMQDLNDSLSAYAHQLEAVNKELEAFTYSVSHDLRAPLRAMDGFSKALLENFTDLPPAAKHYLERIRTNSQHMGDLINSLLMLSRLGRQALYKQPISMNQLVQQVLEEMKNSQDLSKVDFLIADLPDAEGDSSLIEQVFVNLLENAVKYSRTKTHPQIRVGSLENHTYYVKDNGVGFDMAYYNKLFGIFQRLHDVRDFEGTGVGLATTQRIIHRHGGKIWAESKPDEETTFYFTLPEGEA